MGVANTKLCILKHPNVVNNAHQVIWIPYAKFHPEVCHQGNAMRICIWPHPLPYKKKAKDCTSALKKKKNGATHLKLDMQTQLNSVSNIRWVPSGHTSSSLCVRLKMPKILLLKKYFNLITCSLLFQKSTTYVTKADIFCDNSPSKVGRKTIC